MLVSTLAAIIGAIGIVSMLSTSGAAGENRTIKSPTKVSIAVIEVQLSKETQFGMDAVRIADPNPSLGSGTGIINGGIPEILKQLSKVKGVTLVAEGNASAANHDGRGAVFELGTGKRGFKSGDSSTVSVRSMARSRRGFTLSVNQTTKRVTGYKRTGLFKREPIVSKQTLEAMVDIGSGKTAIIGGLIRNDGKRRFESLLLLQPQQP